MALGLVCLLVAFGGFVFIQGLVIALLPCYTVCGML